MHPSPIITIEEIAIERTPEELYGWVMQKSRELGATHEAKLFARSGATLAKKFYDEIFPLAIFARREFSGRNDVRILPNLGNENFDATIIFKDSDEDTLLVEITYSKDGYDESLRMEYLTAHGHVFLTGSVDVAGRRGWSNRRVHVNSEASSRSFMLKQQLSMLKNRIEGKAEKKYGPSHLLLVAVDDYFPLNELGDEEVVDEFLRRLLPSLHLDFLRVIVVGVAGKIYLSYPVA